MATCSDSQERLGTCRVLCHVVQHFKLFFCTKSQASSCCRSRRYSAGMICCYEASVDQNTEHFRVWQLNLVVPAQLDCRIPKSDSCHRQGTVLHTVKTGSGTHPNGYRDSFSEGKAVSSSLLEPTLRTRGVWPPPHHIDSWCGALIRPGTTFPLSQTACGSARYSWSRVALVRIYIVRPELQPDSRLNITCFKKC